MTPQPDDHDGEPTADALIAVMRTASGPRLIELGRRLADLLEREQMLRNQELDALGHTARSLDRAVADLVEAASTSDLLRRACAALADICSANYVLASGVDSGRAIPIANYDHGGTGAMPASYRLPAESAESRVLASRNRSAGVAPVPELRHVFGQGATVMAVFVDDIPMVMIHIAGKLAPAQHDSADLLLEVLGSCLLRLGLSARRTRQFELLRSSGIARESQSDAASAQRAPEPAPTAPSWMEPLTDRESEVLHLILKGASNTAVATELVITVDTVKSHVKRILRKLGATNRSELIARHSGAAFTDRRTPRL